jgi:2-alkenal reductase
MKRKLLIIIAILSMVVALAGCTTQKTSTSSTTIPSSTIKTTTTLPPISVPAAVSGIETTLESIYDRVNPSVVLINVVIPPSISDLGGTALGSGFIWDTQGDIVTNNHVIDGASSITVTFYDGTTVDASLVGADADSDLAVIKVNPSGLQLQPVSVADSTTVQVGQLAIAIGNPWGLENTMTVGFVSAIGRVLPGNQSATGPAYSIPNIIQVDTPINPGNSGGVLLNDNGAVIGVTQSIDTSSGSSSGVGFAIPSSIVKQVVPALITTGHSDHPYLGVSVMTLDSSMATAMNLPSNQHGALVEAVTSGGPADKAGIKASNTNITDNGQQVSVGGDVIIAYNGQVVKSADDLVTFLSNSGSVGQAVTLTILRNGKQIQVQVTLGLRPSS